MIASVRKAATSKLTSNFAIYFSATIANRAIPFLLLPLMTRYLAPGEYGLFAMLQLLITVSVPVVGLGLQSALTRSYFQKDQAYLATLLGTLVAILCASTAVALAAFAGLAAWWPEVLAVPARWAMVVPLIAFAAMLNVFYLTIERNAERPFGYGAFEFGRTLVEGLGALALVALYGLGWEGSAIATALTTWLFAAGAVLALYRRGDLRPTFDRAVARDALYLVLPTVPHALGIVFIAMADRFMVEKLAGLSAVGLYAVGTQFASLLGTITGAFNQAYSPWMYRTLTEADDARKRQIVGMLYAYALGVAVLSAVLTTVSALLIIWMTPPAFHGAVAVVGWLNAGLACRGLYTMVFPYFVHAGRTGPLSVITVTSLALNLLANWWLIPRYGPIGAAQAGLLSNAFSFLAAWWWGHRVHPMPWTRPAFTRLEGK